MLRFLLLTTLAATLFYSSETASPQDDTASPLPAVAEVPPYRLIAADFAKVPRQISSDENAYDGRILRYSARLMLPDLPFPRTSKRLTVYVKVRAESPKDILSLSTGHGKERTSLGYITQQTPGEWVWVRFPAIRGDAIAGRLRLDAVPAREFGRSIALDSIVISTDARLSDKVLDAVPPLFLEHPLAVVNPAGTPPSLDGRGTDPVWKQAVAIRDFLTASTKIPAQLQTTTRFLYDKTHLYLQFVVDEPLLRAADMRMDELFTRATERDQTAPHETLMDDSCMFMLQPKKDGPVYEWTTNTLGTLLDAQMDADNLWETRDVKWNAEGAVSKVERKEGEWIWEMKIPFVALGVPTPQPGESWNVSLIRHSPSRKELSAWNPIGHGAHSSEAWGELRFAAAATVAATPREPLAELHPGSNRIDLDLLAEEGALPVIAAVLSPQNGLPLLTHSATATTEETTHASHQFAVHETVPTTAQWGLFDTAMQPYYVSPRAEIAVRSSVLTLTLSTPGAYEIVVNDSVMATGASAQDKKIKLPMRHGANSIAIRAEAGVATLKLEGTEKERLSDLWRIKAVDDPKATAADFDDRQWPLVSTQETVGDAEKGEALVLRRIILSEHTQVWPVPSPALFIPANSAQPATFKFNGLPERDLADWVTWVAVPETLEVTGVSGYYGARGAQPIFSVEHDGSTEIDGKKLSLYKITADQPLLYDAGHRTRGRTRIFDLMLRTTGEAPFTPRTEQIYYWSQAEKGGVNEMLQSFAVQTVPPLKGKQPKKFVFELWGGYLGVLDSASVQEQMMETIRQAGFNLVVDHRSWVVENGPRHNLMVRAPVAFAPYSINLTPFLEDHPEEQLLRHDGTRSKQWLCTTSLLGARWPVVSKALEEMIRERKLTTICYDYEHSPFTDTFSCFCERCLAAFREEKKIAEDLTLTPEIIKNNHRSAWEDFMARRAAKILAKLKDTVHATIPDGLFTVFSLPQSPRTVSVYGIDWRYVVEENAADVIQIGTTGAWRQQVLPTSKVVGDVPVMYSVYITPYHPNHMIPARVADKAELLRRVLDSTHGVFLFDRATMDGRSWWNVAETTRLVADFEELFLHSRPEPVKDHDPEHVQWLRGEKKQLLCIMNQGREAADFSIAIPETLANGYDYYTGIKVEGTGILRTTVPAFESAVYVFDVQ